jgi:hypothetical protein
MNRLTTFAAVLAVLSGVLFAQSNYTHLAEHDRTIYTSVLSVPTNRVWHSHCILIGEGLETTASYQFVTPWGRCEITHEEWEVLNRVIRRAGANARLDRPETAGRKDCHE